MKEETMPNEFPNKDPRNIWQSQPSEPLKMSAEEIRRKTRRLEMKARVEALTWIVTGLVLFVFFGRTFAKVQELIPRIGWGLLSLWGIYSAYQGYKWIWPRRLRPEATVSASLAFYRTELERRRDYVLNMWRRAGLTFCFIGLAMVTVPALIKALEAPRLLLNVVPFFVLLTIWALAYFPVRKRKRQALQQEIDKVNALERENP
jgi:hypothetical protein